MNEMEFNGQSFFMLIDGDGNVISKLGNEYSEFMKEDLNFFDLILKGKTAEGVYANVHTRMTNGYSGTFKATMNGEKRTLVYVPLGIENWYVIAGVDENYVTKMENLTWEPSKNIISKLVAVLFVFFGLVLAVDLINKIRFAEENRNLENIAETDMLTDLNNKMSTETKIARYMMTSPEKGAVLFVLDIDNFKKINDTMGHAFGDEVLRALGHDIRSVFRVSDVLGRTGGDEFTIFLKNIEGDENIYKESRKMLQFFRDFKVGDYVKYSATASIGVAVYPRDGADFESLYKVADQALYKAKKRGKNQLAFFNEELDKNNNQYT
jgi:diguanylate cyclase (GGDEF)-like protein